MNHLTDLEITYLLCDGVSEAERERALAHLEGCDECTTRVAECLHTLREGVTSEIIPLRPLSHDNRELDDADEGSVLPAAAHASPELPSYATDDRAAVVQFRVGEDGGIHARLLTSVQWFGTGATLEFVEPVALFRFDEHGAAPLAGIRASAVRPGNIRLVRDPRRGES